MVSCAKVLSIALFVVAGCGLSPATERSSAPPSAPPTTEVPTNQADASAAILAPAEVAPAPAAEEPRETAIGEKDILVVSFISPGDGTDHAAYDRLKATLKSLAKVPPFVSRSWGKEGEHDECFDLSGLSAPERQAFIGRVKEAVRSSKKVNLAENGTCHEGR
ncbi:MAG: hypothetical protein BGO98_16955 [Myxococcales bacterium 68-20]|nr:hypothetical protein [Myxococcales bacterium]OJY24589.1 MAG: hypothetical protein BGO98_16955 [Myxococcales bacterium 68-20]